MAVMMAAVTGCNTNAGQERKDADEPFRQEREFMDKAVRNRSQDVMKVDVTGNTVVFTHIYNGIVDMKSYTYEGDVCVAAERVYTFPGQMRALRHYRRAVEQAELYENIELLGNQVKYKLKEDQHKFETEGLTKDQLKARFDRQVASVKADIEKGRAKIHQDMEKLREKPHDMK